jgi:hypothetical protein
LEVFNFIDRFAQFVDVSQNVDFGKFLEQ